MPWVYFWWLLTGLVLGSSATGFVFGYVLRKHFDLNKKLPYRWTCTKDQCHLILSNSRWDGLMRMADEHNRETHNIEGVM